MSAVRAFAPMSMSPPPLAPRLGVAAHEVERLEDKVRTHRSIGISTAVHILALLALLLIPKTQTQQETFTEITLLEPGQPDPGEPAAAPAAVGVRTATGAFATSETDQRFERHALRAELKPVPVAEAAFEDRLQARLATLQSSVSSPAPGVANAPVPGTLAGIPTQATLSGAGGNGHRIDLHRGGTGDGGPPVALTRGAALGGGGSAMAPATLAPGKSVVSAPATESGATLRRNLAGASIMGPVADRPILARTTPVYPEWAMRDGVEGSVTLYFIVKSDGTIRDGILVQKTAGFEDFDENARQALQAWRFQPLAGGRTGDQWGTITFHYRIREGG
jgi:TonB family protein